MDQIPLAERPVPPLPRRTSAILGATCAAALIWGTIHHGHPHFAFEAWPGSVAALGFGSGLLLVTLAKRLRRRLSRPLDYYEP